MTHNSIEMEIELTKAEYEEYQKFFKIPMDGYKYPIEKQFAEDKLAKLIVEDALDEMLYNENKKIKCAEPYAQDAERPDIVTIWYLFED